jgi:hypothetical protein
MVCFRIFIDHPISIFDVLSPQHKRMMTDKARERKYERSTTNQFRRYQPCVAGICLGIAEYNSTVIVQALGSRLKIAIQGVAEPQSYVRFGLRRQWSLRDASMRCAGFVFYWHVKCEFACQPVEHNKRPNRNRLSLGPRTPVFFAHWCYVDCSGSAGGMFKR